MDTKARSDGWRSRTRILVIAGVAVLILVVTVLFGPTSSQKVNGSSGLKTAATGFQGIPGKSAASEKTLLGVCSTDVGKNIKAKYPASQWPYVRNVRLNISWASIEKSVKGHFVWDETDRKVNDALSIGLNNIMLTLGGPIPSWACSPLTPKNKEMGPPRRMQDWGDFSRAVARRYRDYVDYYQIWQEPGWDLDAPPAAGNVIYFYGLCDLQYMGMLRSGYQAIKGADPDSCVITGSMMNGLTRTPTDYRNYEILFAGGGQDFSMKVDSDRSIVAERPMYFNYQGKWNGGHDEGGIEMPQKTWYLAEGATHAGFEEWITIQNPGGKDANVMITYMFPGGATKSQNVPVGAHTRVTVDVNGAVGPNRDVSAKLVADQPIVVERPMYFNYRGAWPGGGVESGVAALSKTWYLAEGTTRSGFEEWISLMNPSATPINVDITYMFQGGGTQKQTVPMKPTSRETVPVFERVPPNKDVSAKIEAPVPIIAERPMYFGYKNKWPGGDTQVGATAAATSWFLSEGTTRKNKNDGEFEEWISIQNPNSTGAEVQLTYMFTGGGTKRGKVGLLPHSRETVLVNKEVGDNQDVSVQLNSNAPVIVERPMYFNYHNKYAGGSIEIGNQKTAKTWYFAEGTTREGFEEWLTLQNPGGSAANATVTFMFNDGTTQKKTVGLPPQSRTTIGVNNSLSMATICDAVAVHPYDYPEYWALYYRTVLDIRNRNGYGYREVAVTEIGWPHAGRTGFTPEGQRQAIGEVGVGSLFGSGCKKIFIFEDVDDPPGKSWDQAYNGLFNYYGNAMPAWNEYKKWQSRLPNYGNKPSRVSIKAVP